MPGKIERDHWHPGFLGAMEIEFRSYRKHLDFDDEHTLSKEPLKMDLLVIKKDRSVAITNQIGNIFRGYNILEYKSPDDGITIDDYYKTMAYAYLYKGLGKTVDEIPGEELTVTMARDVHPDSLFEKIKRSGGTIEQTYPGVYYLSGIFNTPSQILVTSELDPELHASLRILTKRAKEEDVENFLRMTQGFTEPGDRQNADAVLQLSVSANRSVYEEIIRRVPVMCEALRDLMKDEIQKEIQEAVQATQQAAEQEIQKARQDAQQAAEQEIKKARQDAQQAAINTIVGIIKNVKNIQKCDDATAMDYIGIPPADQMKYTPWL